MRSLNVFVDEYGDPSLDVDKEGVSGVYILCAVCISAENLDAARQLAEKARQNFFQSGEMKSSSLGTNDSRRISLLNKLSKLDAFVIGYCAQKGRAKKESGLQFKKTFIKFFARKMYERLHRYSSDLIILADKHGSPDFQNEFRSYLSERFPTDLFGRASFDFLDSRDEVLLQVADVFAGSLARVYDEKKISDRADEIRTSMQTRVSLTVWPEGQELLQGEQLDSDDDSDQIIRRFCVAAVERYLVKQSLHDSDLEHLARQVFLETLLSNHAWGADGGYVPTKVLRREIGRCLGVTMSEHKFRSSVVAKLRDADVVIASCSRGYKIPSCYADIRDYALFANTILPPMISRVERAARSVREATMGRIDVLEEPGLAELKNLVRALS
ncbi:DUF3800 domain-containing protein [Lysobacter sp. Root983]|uniref:DUF3800 domain-containing protein n=1 Tax=Lysobacter sp. Root983 TaxID=1736613 RepID=UPI0009ECC213|nr:DUF3800 domain-containing protein [Lysobacter sp. Root983]